jgi:hypothetical protein
MTAQRTLRSLLSRVRTLASTLNRKQAMTTFNHTAQQGTTGYQAAVSLCVRSNEMRPLFAAPINQHESSPAKFYGSDWTNVRNIRGGNPGR